MRDLRILVLGFVMASGSLAARDGLVEGFPDLPKGARSVAERSVACQHFWGEISGTGDERDLEVAEQLKHLKCDQVDKDLQRIQEHYANSPAVLNILREASQE